MAFSATNQGFLHVLECFLAIGLNLDLLGKEGKRSY